jgi:hypothetical protein
MSFINISNKPVSVEETEEAILLEVAKPKVVEKKDELDISGEVKEQVEEPEKKEEEPIDGDSDAKPKFKPEGFCWTSYDGTPRNYIQIVSKFTKYPIVEDNTTLRNLENTLIEILGNDIHQKDGKIHLINY